MYVMHFYRATKIIFGHQGKRKLGPPPPILQIMMLSPPRCVISKESVQQKWIDELRFRKQLFTCLFVWTLNYNPGAFWECHTHCTYKSTAHNEQHFVVGPLDGKTIHLNFYSLTHYVLYWKRIYYCIWGYSRQKYS